MERKRERGRERERTGAYVSDLLCLDGEVVCVPVANVFEGGCSDEVVLGVVKNGVTPMRALCKQAARF